MNMLLLLMLGGAGVTAFYFYKKAEGGGDVAPGYYNPPLRPPTPIASYPTPAPTPTPTPAPTPTPTPTPATPPAGPVVRQPIDAPDLDTGEYTHDWRPLNPDFPYIRGCLGCNALRVGRNSVIITESNIQMQVAAAPTNPSAGFGKIYAAVDAQPNWLDSGGVSTNMYAAAASSAVTREGGQLTEATSISVSDVDILTASGLSIAASKAVYGIHVFRKIVGFAANAGFGNDNAETGQALVNIRPVVTNYTFGAGSGSRITHLSNGWLGLAPGFTRSITASRPNATLTDYVIRGITFNGSMTIGLDELSVYSFANA